jgi:carboxylesterase type B
MDPAGYGVPHLLEIPYFFRNMDVVGWEDNLTPRGRNKDAYIRMSKLVSRVWIGFAVSGSPNDHKCRFRFVSLLYRLY